MNKISSIGLNWEEVRNEIFTTEEIMESDLRVASIGESIKQISQQRACNCMKKIDENFLEFSLPMYLKKDIDALEKGLETNSTLLDCLFCEVQGSINAAFYNNEITKEQAIFLRKKYLGLEE